MKYLLFLLLALPISAGEINSLSPSEDKAGWQLFFNGRDLADFRAFGSDARPGAGWEIEKGILKKLPGVEGSSIVTKKKYKDFTLVWEWRISEKGNNGVKYLVDESRMKAPGPEYQMLDDSGHRDGKKGAKRQTASLYDIFAPVSDKLLKPVGEWNISRIIVKGNQVEHWLNGSSVLSYELGSPELMIAIAKSKFKRTMPERIRCIDDRTPCVCSFLVEHPTNILNDNYITFPGSPPGAFSKHFVPHTTPGNLIIGIVRVA